MKGHDEEVEPLNRTWLTKRGFRYSVARVLVLLVFFFVGLASVLANYLWIDYIRYKERQVTRSVRTSLFPTPTPTPPPPYSVREKSKFKKPNMAVAGDRYAHALLGFSLPLSYASKLQNEVNIGKRVAVLWPDEGLQITGGYFYGSGNDLLSLEEVARVHLTDAQRSQYEVRRMTYVGYPAVRLDKPTGSTRAYYDEGFSLVVVRKDDVLYELYATNEGRLNQLLSDFAFVPGKTSPTVAELTGPFPAADRKNDVLLFSPADNGITLSRRPTITGKIRQTGEALLPDSFSRDSSGYSKGIVPGSSYFLNFYSGRVVHVTVQLDGTVIRNVYGFPQFPIIGCGRSMVASGDYLLGRYNLSGKLYGTNGLGEPYISYRECFSRSAQELPPVVIYFKPDWDLADGTHALKFSFPGGASSDFTFTVNPSSTLPYQEIPVKPELDAVDNCTPGYYYAKEYLNMPLPTTKNEKLLYRLSFPQSPDERGSVNRREVRIRFGNYLYDLEFPQSDKFYFPDEFRRYRNASDEPEYRQLDPWRSLFVPMQLLYFDTGAKASFPASKDTYAAPYFEIFPVDATGRKYRQSIPWETNGSSSCDG